MLLIPIRHCLPAVLLLLMASGCSSREQRELRLTIAERERLDELVSAEVDSLRPILRRNCDETFAERVSTAVDSIVQQRLEEEARLRARIPQSLRNGR